jgi:hypothetical protein
VIGCRAARRFLRILLNLLTLLSLASCAGTLTMWIRSHHVVNAFTRSGDHRNVQISSGDGWIVLALTDDFVAPVGDASRDIANGFANKVKLPREGCPHWTYAPEASLPWRPDPTHWIADTAPSQVWTYGYDAAGRGVWHVTSGPFLGIRYWPPLAISSLLPAVWCRRRRLRRHIRSNACRCVACG